MFEAEAETFRQAGVRVGLDAEATEEGLLKKPWHRFRWRSATMPSECRDSMRRSTASRTRCET